MTIRRLLLSVLLVACGFAAAVVLMGRMRAEEQAVAQSPAAQRPAPANAAPTVIAPTASTMPDFSRVAARTIPAVVNVSSQQLVRRRMTPFDLFLDPDGSGQSVENSLGSGVIVSPDGFILTNNHVITGDGRPLRDVVDITVVMSDKQEMPARVIAVDQGTDLALLKVEPKKSLPAMPWGDSDKLKVAEWVLAIGNPYQLSETVTLGIVSALNRRDPNINQFGNFIQTDAAINPGNSGGALINANGELIGINTAIFSQSGGYQGIGFAVASNLARQVMSDLQTYHEVRRGTINAMTLMPLTTLVAQRLGVPGENTRGVVVREVLSGSTADRVGFQQYDIIVSYNGTDVVDSNELIRLVGETRIGSTATIVVVRKGKRTELKVPIEPRRQSQR